MGVKVSKTAKSDIDHFNHIKELCKENRNNREFLICLLKSEWIEIINKLNTNKLDRIHLSISSHLIGFIHDDELNEIYTELITKWNTGKSDNSDYNNVTVYIEKI